MEGLLLLKHYKQWLLEYASPAQKRFYYTVLLTKPDGTKQPHQMVVGPEVHKQIQAQLHAQTSHSVRT
jgi:hypothetical protein